jgi:hypothetical protein
VACLLIPLPVEAQFPPVGVPGGVVRVELDGSLETFDRRFRDGRREPYAADLTSSALGSDRIPLLADADTRIGRITGNPSYRINLGGLSTDALADLGTGVLGLSLGLTNRITVFGRIPLVRARVQSQMAVNTASADAGLNPGQADQNPFFTEFDLALATLGAKLAAGDYDGDPSQRALAEATLSDGTALRADLFGLLADPATASPALPITTSAAGTAINGRIAALQNTLASSLAVSGFTLTPALPEAPVSEADLLQLLGSTGGPLQLRLDESSVTFRGDAEAGVALTLVDTWDRGNRRGGLRAALSGLVRLPTGRRPQIDRPLSIGTGDGQTDVQVDLVTDLGAGQFGARLTGSYLRQLPDDILTRVTSPSQPFAGLDRVAMVHWDPGDMLTLGVRPFYRLARTVALQAGVEHWTRSTDRFSYASGTAGLPGIDPNILAEGSKANATLLSVGITYANPGGLRPGGIGLPVDATWAYERVLRAGGGRVPDTHRVAARFRAYFGVW